MRFMMLLKSDKTAEAGVMPDEKLLAAMGKYNEALVNAGVMLGGEGLHPSSKGFRIHNAGGKLTVVDGPFAEAKELIAGFWILQVKSKEEAIAWASRCPFEVDGPSAIGTGEGQIEIRQVTEVSDFAAPDSDVEWVKQQAELRGGTADGLPIAVAPKPESEAAGAPKLKYMMMFKADKKSEAGILPSQQLMNDMGNLMGEMAAAGVMISGEGLQPSSKGARITFSHGKRTVTDGPFTEAKEMIAGYCIVQVKSKEEAIDWASRGSKINGDGESEVRQVFQASDFGAEFTPELREAEERLAARIAAQQA